MLEQVEVSNTEETKLDLSRHARANIIHGLFVIKKSLEQLQTQVIRQTDVDTLETCLINIERIKKYI